MTDSDLLARMGVDSELWTDEFFKSFNGRVLGDEGEPNTVCPGTMLGWFANAIMAGHAVGFKNGKRFGAQNALDVEGRRIADAVEKMRGIDPK